MIKGKLLKIKPLRKGLTEYLDEEQLHVLKKKLDIELKILKFLGLFRVADTDCLSFARDESDQYIYTEQSARFYAKKHARTLFDEELIDIYLVKYDNSCGRGENIYVVNENGLRLLGINEDFDTTFNDIHHYLKKTQYTVYKKEELLHKGYKVLNIFFNRMYFHIKYSNREDIFNEYVFYDEYDLILKFKQFFNDHIKYNDTYTILIEDYSRSKELKAIINEEINPLVLEKKFKIIEQRNSRNQKTLRPNLQFLRG